MAGIPADRIVEAHGSFASHHCIECGSSYAEQKMTEAIEKRIVLHCEMPQCHGLVKPDIVFFGEALPAAFHHHKSIPADADLCIVMGTSLTVQPFASLPNFCVEGVPRLLINLERVGSLGSRADDVLFLGDCDAGVRKLAKALGWLSELESLWKTTTADVNHAMLPKDQVSGHEKGNVDLQVAKLSEEVDRSLRISDSHRDILCCHLTKKHEVWISGALTTDGDNSKATGNYKNRTRTN